MNISKRRIYAIILRHLYNFFHTWDRLVDAFYWPAMDIVILGLTIGSVAKVSGPYFIQSIIFGVILWYVLWRGQYEITVNILEEFWAENLVNIFSTPLQLKEWVISLLSLGLIKLFLTVSFTSALGMYLYHVNVMHLGGYFFLFILSLLLMGWAFGLFVGGLFMRYGTDIQTFAWAGGFILMPFSATYYPLSSLPKWVQAISQFVPSMYIFESMRALLQTGKVPTDMLVKSFSLDIFFWILGLSFFIRSFKFAMKRGLSHVK